MKILFLSDLFTYYKESLSDELLKLGVKNFELTTETDNYKNDICFIIYSPTQKNGKKVKRDFSSYKNLIAVLSLYAGIEDIVENETLKCPLIKMIDNDGLTKSMIEWCLAHTLRLHLDIDKHILGQDGFWRHKIKPPIAKDRTVGILGLGALGKPVAVFLNKIGFKVFGWSRTQKKIDHIKCLYGSDGLKQILSVSEILILLLPLTSETRFILNDQSLKLLPKNSKIINAGRGELIKDNALIKKLRSGHVKNATLDVFQQEPLPKKHPYWILPNVTVTPHIAADTPVESSTKVIANNIKDLLQGKLPNGMVDLNKGY
tara:strand:+ start:4446 stop:5396 length:951 start_codon:yes stop_codon:yes gene_type:complete